MIPSQILFQPVLDNIHKCVNTVEGQLTPREIACLAWLGAAPTLVGEILEIGTFKGPSTIVLALAARLEGVNGVAAVIAARKRTLTSSVHF